MRTTTISPSPISTSTGSNSGRIRQFVPKLMRYRPGWISAPRQEQSPWVPVQRTESKTPSLEIRTSIPASFGPLDMRTEISRLFQYMRGIFLSVQRGANPRLFLRTPGIPKDLTCEPAKQPPKKRNDPSHHPAGEPADSPGQLRNNGKKDEIMHGKQQLLSSFLLICLLYATANIYIGIIEKGAART